MDTNCYCELVTNVAHDNFQYKLVPIQCDHIARKFCRITFLRKLIRLSFRNFIFTDSDPIAIINDVNIVSWIKIFVGRDKSAKTAKILPRETF